LELIAGLRATRHFSDAPVGRDEVERILDAARWTGSARNRQPWRCVSVADPDLQARLARVGDYAGHLGVAPGVLVLLSDDSAGSDTEFGMGRLCQSIALAARAVGLGSCPATLYPQDNADTAARLLGAAAPWSAHHALTLGRPAPAPAGRSAIPTGRLPVTEVLTHVDVPATAEPHDQEHR